jgi:uncharacterized protein
MDPRSLHQKYASGKYAELYLDLVWTHSVIVSEIALRIADKIKFANLDLDLIKNGSLLHDIGMYMCHDQELNPEAKIPELQHGFEGAQILAKEGLDIKLQRFCLTHTATGLTAEDIERENLRMEIKDYLPVTVEEEIVCYADKFHTKYPAFSKYEKIAERIGKFDSNRYVRLDTFRRKYGIPDLSDLVEEYAIWSAEIDRRINEIAT